MTVTKQLMKDVLAGKAVDSLYGPSVQVLNDNVYALSANTKDLYVYANEKEAEGFLFTESETEGGYVFGKGSCNHHNMEVLQSVFTWLKPVKRTGYRYSFGLGDRLGLATRAHLQVFKGRGVLPVAAQQSIRELMLAGRTYKEVLDAAAWSVFAEGYTDGYSADGDHLKHAYEIEYAIQSGFPMITLDCSEHIRDGITSLSDADLQTHYVDEISEASRRTYEGEYLNKKHTIGDVSVEFTTRSLQETVLIYEEALHYAESIYNRYVVPFDLDFEVSIDETAVPTTVENHFFIANEFKKKGVVVETMAPRFCGEFQKAIDYIGDIAQFETEYKVHEAIAKAFNYRLSIHSGSDKFSVYPAIGSVSKEGWHVKTAGTNWLEALRVIARCDVPLMKEIYTYAVANLDNAKRFYVIDATTENAPKLESYEGNIEGLLNDDTTRQILHVTFGLLLQASKDNASLFKGRIYDVLDENYDVYVTCLSDHIGKHLTLLGK